MTGTTVQNVVEATLISPMTEHDLLEVVEIEELSRLSRWGWSAYYSELQGPNRDFMFVALGSRQGHNPESSRIAGYVVARLVTDELHINNVAVRELYRRRGIANSLLNRVLQEARQRDAETALLEVRAGNEAAQALYAKCGFRIISRRGNYYCEPREDAVVMSLRFDRNPA